MAHKGSWFGLPDFGVTETIGGLFNRPTTYQGGSNLIGSQPQPKVATVHDPYAGTQSSLNYSPMQTNSGGGSTGGTVPTNTGDTGGGTTTGPSPEELLRQQYINEINQRYGSLEAELDPQKAAQEGIVTNSYNQSLADLTASTESNKKDVLTNQVKTLKDLTNNLKNQYQAGNIYLGARGAGDSSAANMYSYAINKLGSQARGDVLSQTNAQLAKLNTIFTQEQSRLDTEKNNNLLQVANWYSQAKQQLQGMKGQDLAALSQTLLQNALSALNQINTNFQSKQSALQEWAMNNSTNLSELKVNMAGISSQLPTMQPISALPKLNVGSNYSTSSGYYPGFGYSSDELKKLSG